MATVTLGYNAPTGFTSGETVTATKLNSLGQPVVSAIQTADISDAQITTAKIADDAVTAAKLDGVASINQQTGNYTLVLSDAGRVIEVDSASNLTVTIPANSSVAFATGATIVVTRRGSGDVTIAGAGGVTVRSSDSNLKIAKQYVAAACIKIGTDEWLVLGNLKA